MIKEKKGKDKESTALAVTLANDKALGEVFVESGFFSDAKEQSQAVVKILAGREVGLQPIESMTGIHVIKGKISLGANMMASAVKKNPDYDYRVTKHTDNECVIDFFQNGENIGTSSFTIKDAERAGVIVSGGSWKKYPKAMLFARAISAGVRYYCPDVFGYAPMYVPEEMGAEVDGEGEPINVTPPIDIPKQSKKEEKANKEFVEAEFKDAEEDSDYECTCPATCLVHEDGGAEPEEDDEGDKARDIPDDIVEEGMKPREALQAIESYAFKEEIGDKVRPIIVKHYPKYDDGSIFLYHIPENKVIKIVEELTGNKLKKAEKAKKCKQKTCGKRITEPESEEQDGLCLKCWLKEND